MSPRFSLVRILRSLRTVVPIAGLSLLGAAANGAVIQGAQITPTTTLGQYLSFSINQIADGISNDSPLNGYASGFGVTTGRITFTLGQDYDLSSFLLWNDINILNEGVRSFSMTFENSSAVNLGSVGPFSAISQFAPQTYTFPSVFSGVRTVHLDVLASNLQIEIREVAFNGSASAVPEPSSTAAVLAGAAISFCVWRRRSV